LLIIWVAPPSVRISRIDGYEETSFSDIVTPHARRDDHLAASRKPLIRKFKLVE
jgi:hypothetical protein